jgi:hypothetical protein
MLDVGAPGAGGEPAVAGVDRAKPSAASYAVTPGERRKSVAGWQIVGYRNSR